MRASSPVGVAASGSANRSAAGGDGGWDRNADAIAKTLQSGNYELTLAMLEQRKQERRSEPFGLTVVRGWAMFHKGDWEGAKQVFAELAAKGHAEEAEDGLTTIPSRRVSPSSLLSVETVRRLEGKRVLCETPAERSQARSRRDDRRFARKPRRRDAGVRRARSPDRAGDAQGAGARLRESSR